MLLRDEIGRLLDGRFVIHVVYNNTIAERHVQFGWKPNKER